MQLDNPDRGFSFMREGPLDMRMDIKGSTAADVINGLAEEELADIIYHYGDEQKARRIARRIVEYRKIRKIHTTIELADTVKKCFPKKLHPSSSDLCLNR